jgi:signal transduction histidine kinase
MRTDDQHLEHGCRSRADKRCRLGLDPNTASRIFEPFYATKAAGMGMGLSTSRSIVQNHGGRLWATANKRHRSHLSIHSSEVPGKRITWKS